MLPAAAASVLATNLVASTEAAAAGNIHNLSLEQLDVWAEYWARLRPVWRAALRATRGDKCWDKESVTWRTGRWAGSWARPWVGRRTDQWDNLRAARRTSRFPRWVFQRDKTCRKTTVVVV